MSFVASRTSPINRVCCSQKCAFHAQYKKNPCGVFTQKLTVNLKEKKLINICKCSLFEPWPRFFQDKHKITRTPFNWIKPETGTCCTPRGWWTDTLIGPMKILDQSGTLLHSNFAAEEKMAGSFSSALRTNLLNVKRALLIKTHRIAQERMVTFTFNVWMGRLTISPVKKWGGGGAFANGCGGYSLLGMH